jgi:phosphoribosylpyrophosphate synthetase
MANFALFAGSANPSLAAAIAAELGVRPAACAIQRFPDGETAVVYRATYIDAMARVFCGLRREPEED